MTTFYNTFICVAEALSKPGISFEELRMADYISAYRRTKRSPQPICFDAGRRIRSSRNGDQNAVQLQHILTPACLPEIQYFYLRIHDNEQYHSLSCMPQFQHLSHEELRYYAYLGPRITSGTPTGQENVQTWCLCPKNGIDKIYTIGGTVKLAAHISRLNANVLYEIFLLNTYRNLDHWERQKIKHDELLSLSPLTITRRTSQVCSAWRKILLCSPVIWARCIDLDALGQRTDKWRNVVVARTGNSTMLSITATNPTSFTGVQAREKGRAHFISAQIHRQWERIEEIDVVVDAQDLEGLLTLASLGRPARRLKIFVVRSIAQILPYIRPAWSQLFSGFAPSLERLAICYHREFALTVTIFAPRLLTRNMRRLTLMCADQQRVRELLQACLAMPQLETLKVYNMILSMDLTADDALKIEGLPRPIMPLLMSLVIYTTTLSIYPTFLDRLTLHKDCSIFIGHLIDHRSMEEDYLSAVSIKTMLRRYLNPWLPMWATRITLSRFRKMPAPDYIAISTAQGSKFERSFRYMVWPATSFLLPTLARAFLDSISPIDPDRLVFDFDSFHQDPSNVNANSRLFDTDPVALHTVQIIGESIRRLDISFASLPNISSIPGGVLFPELHTIYIYDYKTNTGAPPFPEFAETIVLHLKSIQRVSKLKALIINQGRLTDDKISFLRDQLHGINIYICMGSTGKESQRIIHQFPV